jgi:hypothetical protein
MVSALGATTVEPEAIVRLLVVALLLNVFTPLPENASVLKLLVAVRVPPNVCAVLLLK